MITNHTTFACPHCGAPGWVEFGEAKYTCMCRFRSAPEQPVVTGHTSIVFRCGNCGKDIAGETSHRCITATSNPS